MSSRKIIQDPLEKDFIRLLTDFGFKRVFGSKEHAGILKRFLNALFEGEMRIEKVEFRDKEILPAHINGKKVQFDIYCTTDTDHHFILTEEEAVAYSESYLKELDNQSVLRFTAKKNREEGRQEGKMEGILEVARNMLKNGMSVFDVSRFTNIPESEILTIV